MQAKEKLCKVALAFLIKHQAEHLSRDRRFLVKRCIEHLIDIAQVSACTAEDIALQAIGELESCGRREYIDLVRTTSYAVFVYDPLTGRKRVFTVADLMKLVRTPALASQPVPSSRERLAGQFEQVKSFVC